MNKYLQKEYNHKPRWISYYHQYRNIFDLKPKTVLEIGAGSGITAKMLKENNVKINTIDNDPKTNPDIIGNVLKIPFKNNSFDLVVAFEVLEHLPFESFSKALKEMRRVAKKNLIISLPDHAKSLLRLTFKIPFIEEKDIQLRIPAINNKKHWEPSGHYWEMGNIDYPYNKIAKKIKKNDLEIIKSYVPNESSWTRYFVLKKI